MNEVGATGRAVASNLLRLRGARNLSTAQLSKLLGELGRPIQPTGITKIEKGQRKVDVDDLVVLAAALGVNPSALLLPVHVEPDDHVEITGVGEVLAVEAWAWMDGRGFDPVMSAGEPSVARGRLMYQAKKYFELHGRPHWLVDIPAEG